MVIKIRGSTIGKGNKHQGGDNRNSHRNQRQSVNKGAPMVILFFHGLVFTVHLLLVRILHMQVIIHLKGPRFTP